MTTKADLALFIDDLRRNSNDSQTRRKCHNKLMEMGRHDLLLKDEEDTVQEKRPSATHPPRRDV